LLLKSSETTKKAIKKGFEMQTTQSHDEAHAGFSL